MEDSQRPKVLILGSGPNRIGQGVEFDYSCVHACYALHDAGYDIDFLSGPTRPGRPAPITVGTVVRLGLDAELRQAVREAASNQDLHEADYIEEVLRQSIGSS